MTGRLAALALALGIALTLSMPASSFAQATTSGSAIRTTHIGQLFNVVINDTTETQKWFKYDFRAGRSYCAEVGSGASEAQTVTGSGPDSVLDVYRADAATVVITNDDVPPTSEPGSFRGSRACFIASASETHFVRVTDLNAGTFGYELRVVETTLFGSWFFVGGDYNSFLLLRNTTSGSVNYTVNWRNPAGAIVGTTSGSIGANAGLGVNAKTIIADPVTNFNGTVEVVHNGPPESLVGQITSLSATTGIAYDSTLFQRKAW